MKCSKAHKLISPYIDSELPEVEMRAIEDHLKVCPRCRTEFEEMQGLSYLFTNTDKFKAPHGFHTRVMANINTAKTKGMSRIPILASFAEVIVIILVIVIGMSSGSFLAKDLVPQKTRDLMGSLSLDLFDSTPPGTLGGAYLAMTEGKDEK